MKDLSYLERKQIKQGIDAGYSLSEISRTLNRGKNTVVYEVRRNGGPKNYCPQKAHDLAQQRHQEKRNKATKQINRVNPWDKMKVRIESLEIKIETVIEIIRELQGR